VAAWDGWSLIEPAMVAEPGLLRTFRPTDRLLSASSGAACRAAAHGLRGIGHLDWFRQSHQALWPLLRSAVLGEVALEAPAARA
jgi:hypothetical protein